VVVVVVMVMDQQRALDAYERAWTRTDEQQVRAEVEECWTAASVYVNPLTDFVHGMDGLIRLILDYPVLFPDAQMRRVGEPQSQDRHVRYAWRLTSTARIRLFGRDFGHTLNGTDIIEFDADKKIKTVVSLFGT
jgi:hypothetical protein